MSYDTMNTCAALTLAMVIEDMAKETGRPQEIIRKEILESKAYECLLDFDSGLWGQGPDYFKSFYKKVAESEKEHRNDQRD